MNLTIINRGANKIIIGCLMAAASLSCLSAMAADGAATSVKLLWEAPSLTFDNNDVPKVVPIVPLGNDEIGLLYNGGNLEDCKIYKYNALTGSPVGEPVSIAFNPSFIEASQNVKIKVRELLGQLTKDSSGNLIIMPSYVNSMKNSLIDGKLYLVNLLDTDYSVKKSYSITNKVSDWDNCVPSRITALAITGDCSSGNFNVLILGRPANISLDGDDRYSRIWIDTFTNGKLKSVKSFYIPDEDVQTANQNYMNSFIKASDDEIILETCYYKDRDTQLDMHIRQYHLQLENGEYVLAGKGADLSVDLESAADGDYKPLGAKAFEFQGINYFATTTSHDNNATSIAMYSYKDSPYENIDDQEPNNLIEHTFNKPLEGYYHADALSSFAVEHVSDNHARLYVSTPSRGIATFALGDGSATGLESILDKTDYHIDNSGLLSLDRPAVVSIASIDGSTVFAPQLVSNLDLNKFTHGIYIMTIDGHSIKIKR